MAQIGRELVLASKHIGFFFHDSDENIDFFRPPKFNERLAPNQFPVLNHLIKTCNFFFEQCLPKTIIIYNQSSDFVFVLVAVRFLYLRKYA